MTLYDLVNSITIQGAVRVSEWEFDWDMNADERVLFQTDGTDDFGPGDLEDSWEDKEVEYMFCSDGVLHIEVKCE